MTRSAEVPDIPKRHLLLNTRIKRASVSLPELMDMDIHTALEACDDLKLVKQRLTVLKELGLGYLT